MKVGARASKVPRATVAGVAAGAVTLVAGFVLSAVAAPAADPGFVVGYEDRHGRVVLVGAMEQLPATAARQFRVDLGAPLLPGPDGAAVPVDPGALRQRLDASGVLRRAALPAGGARLVALMPLLFTCAGLLALAFLLPSWLTGAAETVGRVGLVAAACLASFLLLRTGAMGWPGTNAWRADAALQWTPGTGQTGSTGPPQTPVPR